MTSRKNIIPNVFALIIIAFSIILAYSALLTIPKNYIVGESVPFVVYPNEIVKNNFFQFYQIGLWDNKVGTGYPLMATLGGQFYPINLLSFLLPNQLNNINYLTIGQLILAGFSMYYLLKILQCNNTPSLFGSLVYSINLYVVTFVNYGFLFQIYSFLWMPLTIAFLWQALFHKKIIYAVLSGISFSMDILSMSNFTMFLNVIICELIIFYFCYSLIMKPKNILAITKQVILYSAILFVTAIGLSSVKLLPVLELKSLSMRNSFPLYGGGGREWLSLTVNSFFQNVSLIPAEVKIKFFSITNYIYFFFILFAFLKRSKGTIFFTLLSMIAIWAAFSRNASIDIYPIFYYFAPLINTMDIPLRFLLISNFSIPIIFALGLHLFYDKYVKNNRLKSHIVLIVLTVCMVIPLIIANKIEIFQAIKRDILTSTIPSGNDNKVNSVLSSLTKSDKDIFRIASFYTPSGKYVTPYTAFHNGFYLTNNLHWTTTYQYLDIYTNTTANSEYLRKQYKLLQIMNAKYIVTEKKYQDLADNYTLVTKINNGVNYNNPLTHVDVAQIYRVNKFIPFVSEINHPILFIGVNDFNDFNAFEAKTIMLNEKFDLNNFSLFTGKKKLENYSLNELKNFDEIVINKESENMKIPIQYKNYKLAGGKILFVSFNKRNYEDLRLRSNSIMSDSPAKYLNNNDISKIENSLDALAKKDNLNGDRISILFFSPEYIKISINMTVQKTALRISDSYYPGWNLLIDGKKSEVYMADGMIKGVIVNGKGTHIIELKYKPWSFYVGSAISGFTFIIVLLYFFTRLNLFKNCINSSKAKK